MLRGDADGGWRGIGTNTNGELTIEGATVTGGGRSPQPANNLFGEDPTGALIYALAGSAELPTATDTNITPSMLSAPRGKAALVEVLLASGQPSSGCAKQHSMLHRRTITFGRGRTDLGGLRVY